MKYRLETHPHCATCLGRLVTPDEMAALKRRQVVLRGHITRAYNKMDSYEEFDYEQVAASYKELNEIEEKIYADGMTDADERKVAKYAKHMRAIRKAKGLNKRNKDEEKKPSIKLALEEVPTFDGTFQEWQVFKAMFTRMVDKNDNLSEDDKVRYLIRACAG